MSNGATRVGPSPTGSEFLYEEEVWTQTQGEGGLKTQTEGSHLQPKKEASEGIHPAQSLDLKFLASRTLRKQISIV